MKKLDAIMFGSLDVSDVLDSELINESSMNFDLESVVPFLTELNTNFEMGFDVKKLGEFTASVPLNAEKLS